MNKHVAKTQPDLTNGIRFVSSDRHTGYVNRDAYKSTSTSCRVRSVGKP
jgi:hypothetical protein